MRQSGKQFLILLCLLFISTASWGANPLPEMLNARALALSGAVTSIPDHMMAVRANPAGLAPVRTFLGGINYLSRDENQYNSFSATVIDNISSPYAGALQYLRILSQIESEEIGLSLASGSPGKYWGVSARFVHGRTNKDDDLDTAIVGDVGGLLMTDSGVRIGLVGRDLFGTTFAPLERRAALGVSMPFDVGAMFSVDLVRYLDHDYEDGNSIHMGTQYSLPQTPWTVRAGYIIDEFSKEESYSFGFGWDNKSLSLDYGFQQNLEIKEEMIHVVALSGPF
jgi:hypothetical protein